MTDYLNLYPAARAFAEANAQQCAQEIVAWRETAIYKGTALRELADILSPVSPHRDMRLAEDLVIEVALAKLAGTQENSSQEAQQ